MQVKNDPKVIDAIKEYLQSHIQFALATNGDHPWIATMFYGSDSNLNIYFLTDPKTIHAVALNQNPLVSAVIADSPQKPETEKKGIQLYGSAHELREKAEIETGFTIWRRALNVTDPKYSYEAIMSGDLKYRLYELTPKKIKYYNEELWEDDEQTIEL